MTGLLYVNANEAALDKDLALVDAPLASLTLEQVRPPRAVLDEVMAGLRSGRS